MKIHTIRRFAFIETRLLYGGGITAQELGDMFELSRQAAQAVIKRYATLHPENIERDLSLRRQVASENFRPLYIQQDVRLFLDHLRGQALSGFFFEEVYWSEDVTVEDVGVRIKPKIHIDAAQALLLGLFYKHPVYVEYMSKKKKGSRLLSPHAIIFAHNRYLVRCYCHLEKVYLDFSMSRVMHAELKKEEEWVSGTEDVKWQEYVELRYVPNPKLPLEAQEAIREDYLLGKNEPFRIRCREATVFYIRKEIESEKIRSTTKWVPAEEAKLIVGV